MQDQQNPASRVGWRGITAVAVASLLMGTITLIYPFGRDQGNYAYAGWVWLEGARPYVDVFVFKPPATMWVHGLAIALFGQDMLAIRLLDLAWTAATAVLVAWTATLLFERRALGIVAGLLVPFLYYQHSYWNTAQTDGWMNLPMAGAVLALLLAGRALDAGQRPRAAGWYALGGLAVGLALLFKYTSAVIGLPMLVVLGLTALRHRREAVLGALLCGGVAAGVLSASFASLWLSGAWPAFVDSQFDLVPTYVQATRKSDAAAGAWKMLERLMARDSLRLTGIAALIGLVPLVAWAVRGGRRERVGMAVAGAWLVAAVVCCLAQGKFFSYHYLPLIPPAAILGAAAVSALSRMVAVAVPPRPARIGFALLAGAVVFSSSVLPMRFRHLGEVAFGEMEVEEYWRERKEFRYRDYTLEHDLELAEHLEQTTSPDDRAFVWGFDPVVNYLARRKTVSRFLYNYPFAVSWGDPEYEDELLDALEDRPPEVFVVSSGDATPFVTGNKADSRKLFERFDALERFVESRYRLETRIHRFDVYRLEEDGG